MKIAYFSESQADQAALAIFAEALLGATPEPVQGPGPVLEAHGVGGVFSALDGVIRGLHYQSDAEGLIVVVDSDDTTPHDKEHDEPGKTSEKCRYCRLKTITARALAQLKPIATKPKLRVALGLAVPAIEAWYLSGKNHQVGEAHEGYQTLDRRRLKTEVYGTDRPSLELEEARAKEEVTRIVANLARFESEFPIGFGLMANEIRTWRTLI